MIRFSASSIASIVACPLYHDRHWNANHPIRILARPGAIFFAMRAASIGIVPDQQNGSTSGVENFRPDISTSAAARFSLIGASHVCARYPRLCIADPVVLIMMRAVYEACVLYVAFLFADSGMPSR